MEGCKGGVGRRKGGVRGSNIREQRRNRIQMHKILLLRNVRNEEKEDGRERERGGKEDGEIKGREKGVLA